MPRSGSKVVDITLDVPKKGQASRSFQNICTQSCYVAYMQSSSKAGRQVVFLKPLKMPSHVKDKLLLAAVNASTGFVKENYPTLLPMQVC